MGCGRAAYWCGNFFFDLFMFSISFTFLIILPVCFGIDIIYGSMAHFMPFMFLTFMFGVTMISFAYVFGFLFTDAN